MKIVKKKKKHKIARAKDAIPVERKSPVVEKPFKAPAVQAWMRWKGPEYQETPVSIWHVWHTEDNAYRVVRSIASAKSDDTRNFVACLGKSESYRVLSNHKTLLRAMEACRIHFINFLQCTEDDVATNEREMNREAEKLGLDILPMTEDEKAKMEKEKKLAEPVVVAGPLETEKKAQEKCNKVLVKKKAKEGEDGRGKNRYNLFGHPVTAVIRWMGVHDWTEKQAKKALKKFGIKVAGSTLLSQLRGGKTGQRGSPANLTKKEEKELKDSIK